MVGEIYGLCALAVAAASRDQSIDAQKLPIEQACPKGLLQGHRHGPTSLELREERWQVQPLQLRLRTRKQLALKLCPRRKQATASVKSE